MQLPAKEYNGNVAKVQILYLPPNKGDNMRNLVAVFIFSFFTLGYTCSDYAPYEDDCYIVYGTQWSF